MHFKFFCCQLERDKSETKNNKNAFYDKESVDDALHILIKQYLHIAASQHRINITKYTHARHGFFD